MIKYKILFSYTFIFLVLILSISIAFAEELSDDDVIIEADSLENMIDRKLKASGNATIIKSDQRIEADLIEYDQISEELYARGNVILDTSSSPSIWEVLVSKITFPLA